MNLSYVDLFAIVWFFLIWIGYAHYAEMKGKKGKKSLMGISRLNREDWWRAMLSRELRIVDITVITNLSNSAIFFASTSSPKNLNIFSRSRASRLFITSCAEKSLIPICIFNSPTELNDNFLIIFAKLTLAVSTIYLFGIMWLGTLIGWDKPIFSLGVAPFLLAEAFKILLLSLLVKKLIKLKSFI